MKLSVARLGVVPYGQALALQLALRERLQKGEATSGWVICVEHPPTVTLGKRGQLEHLISPTNLDANGVEVFRIDRGGEATFHGPGQLVIYPVLRLADFNIGVVDLIRGLAGSLSATLAEHHGIQGHYDVKHPGVWTDETPSRKIASVGMRVSGGVTTHGAAINLVNDMSPFGWIVACGMPEAPMIRLQDVDPDATLPEFRERFLKHFGEFLEVDWVEAEVELPTPADWIPAEVR